MMPDVRNGEREICCGGLFLMPAPRGRGSVRRCRAASGRAASQAVVRPAQNRNSAPTKAKAIVHADQISIGSMPKPRSLYVVFVAIVFRPSVCL